MKIYFGSSIIICYLLAALTPAIQCGEDQTWVPFPFKSEKQAVAIVEYPREGSYGLAKPGLEGDQIVFMFHEPIARVTYSCPTNEKQRYYTAVDETRKSVYKYHECKFAPRVVMRGDSLNQLLERLFPGRRIQQLGYEITEKPTEITRFGNFLSSHITSETKPPLVQTEPISTTTPTSKFVPLIGFVYDETEFTTPFVEYFISAAYPLSIETEYTLEYNKVNPVDGEDMSIDQLYATEFYPKYEDYSLASWYSEYESHFELGLMKRQLVPKDDLVMFTWKNAAFFDALTAPMWKSIRTKWDVVEQFVRRLANVLHHLEIYAGTAGIMNFEDDFHNLHKAYLSHPLNKMKIPVPAYFWKAVINRNMNIGVLIVMHNDPFGLNKEKICSDISYEKRWLFYNNDSATGLIYSCELTIENISKLLPAYAQPSGLRLQDLQSELPKNIFDEILQNVYA